MSAARTVPLRPQVRQTDVRGEWRLCEPLVVLDRLHGGTRGWVVPEGFQCDFASVPRFARALIQTTDLGTAGPFVHDYLYRHGGMGWYTRAEADRLFRALLEQDGVPAWRRWLAYRAVRWFGGGAWRDTPERRRAA